MTYDIAAGLVYYSYYGDIFTQLNYGDVSGEQKKAP